MKIFLMLESGELGIAQIVEHDDAVGFNIAIFGDEPGEASPEIIDRFTQMSHKLAPFLFGENPAYVGRGVGPNAQAANADFDFNRTDKEPAKRS